jgi:hypothetical protein
MKHLKVSVLSPSGKGIARMDGAKLREHICTSFDGLNVAENSGDTFFIYDPDGDLPPERTFPFATIVTGDNYDGASVLTKPGDYRLNIGLTKATYVSWFGGAPTRRDEQGVLETGYDYAVRDQIMPHPIYASQYWICVINPSAATLELIHPMLSEAYEFAIRKYANQRTRRSGHTD